MHLITSQTVTESSGHHQKLRAIDNYTIQLVFHEKKSSSKA